MTTAKVTPKAKAKCGTRAKYQQHKKRGEPVDAACAQANRDEKREWRKDPEHKEREQQENAARSRALWRLADLFPHTFQDLYRQERDA